MYASVSMRITINESANAVLRNMVICSHLTSAVDMQGNRGLKKLTRATAPDKIGAASHISIRDSKGGTARDS